LTAKIPGHIAPAFGACGRFWENRKTQDAHLFLILLKSNYGLSHLSPGNSGILPKLGRLLNKLLICSLLFFDVFSKQPFRRYYTQPTPSGKPFPRFSRNFSPKTKNQTRFLDYSPLPFLLSPFIHSRPRQSNSNNFRNTPDPSNPPASKNFYPFSFQHFQPPPPAVAGKTRTMTRKRTLRKCAKDF